MQIKGKKIKGIKFFFHECARIYKIAPAKIMAIWILDLLCIVIDSINPYVIGKCIDGLLEKKWFYFFILVITEGLLLIVRAADQFWDTRLYSSIMKNEKSRYYLKATENQLDNSVISSRLSEIDRTADFLENEVVEVLSILMGIGASLFFLYFQISRFIALFGCITVILIFMSTYSIQQKIAKNNKIKKDLDERRIKKIESRNGMAYEQFLRKTAKIEINDSDLYTKLFCISRTIQMIFLIVSIVFIVYTKDFTSGLLYSTITYVFRLSGNADEINDIIIDLNDLADTGLRFQKDYNKQK